MEIKKFESFNVKKGLGEKYVQNIENVFINW